MNGNKINEIVQTVLVVDDQIENIVAIKAVLKRLNVNVMSANNGVQAIEVADRELPDMIILDIVMPEMDGFEACRILKGNDRTKDIPIMFLTSQFKEIKDKVKGLDMGADDYLLKPFDNLELAARVKVMLRLSAAQKFLIQKNRHYMEMLSFISHELKNPLTSILTVAETFKNGILGDLTPEQKHMIDISDRNAEYIHSMINRYLSLAKLEKGEMHPEISEFEFFNDVFEPVISHIQLIIKQNNKKLIKGSNVNDKKINFVSDPNFLKIVLNNLLSNAIKYSDERGEIIYDYYTENNELIIKIKNSSAGLNENEISKLFNKFERLKNEISKKQKGSGLGLYNTKEILKLINGTVECSSELGEYVEFIVKVKNAE
jgi:two-component system sensor histidine kinase/response regulator